MKAITSFASGNDVFVSLPQYWFWEDIVLFVNIMATIDVIYHFSQLYINRMAFRKSSLSCTSTTTWKFSTTFQANGHRGNTWTLITIINCILWIPSRQIRVSPDPSCEGAGLARLGLYGPILVARSVQDKRVYWCLGWRCRRSLRVTRSSPLWGISSLA